LLLSDVNRMNKLYEKFMRETGIYCLSTIKDDILMWSHYAESHRGLCLEFDTTKELLFNETFSVHYSNEYPSIDLIKMGLNTKDEFRKAVLVKSKHWQYEHEWRILRPKSFGGPGIYAFQPESVTGVILGALISPEDKNKIINWVKNYPTKIAVFQAKINRTKYQLDIDPVEYQDLDHLS